MEIVKADEALAEKHKDDILEMIYSTGPKSFDYMYSNDREFLNHYFGISLQSPGTLYARDAISLAVDGNELLGMLCSMTAPNFVERRNALGMLGYELTKSGELSEEKFKSLGKRSAELSWLNPIMRPHVYYILAIATKPEHRGKGIGVKLFDHAKNLGREAGSKVLELDVLSGNPAIEFYKGMGMKILVESKTPIPFEAGVPTENRMGMRL